MKTACLPQGTLCIHDWIHSVKRALNNAGRRPCANLSARRIQSRDRQMGPGGAARSRDPEDDARIVVVRAAAQGRPVETGEFDRRLRADRARVRDGWLGPVDSGTPARALSETSNHHAHHQGDNRDDVIGGDLRTVAVTAIPIRRT